MLIKLSRGEKTFNASNKLYAYISVAGFVKKYKYANYSFVFSKKDL